MTKHNSPANNKSKSNLQIKINTKVNVILIIGIILVIIIIISFFKTIIRRVIENKHRIKEIRHHEQEIIDKENKTNADGGNGGAADVVDNSNKQTQRDAMENASNDEKQASKIFITRMPDSLVLVEANLETTKHLLFNGAYIKKQVIINHIDTIKIIIETIRKKLSGAIYLTPVETDKLWIEFDKIKPLQDKIASDLNN